jgi:uncharacterized protein YjbJ (UPF0337 family)
MLRDPKRRRPSKTCRSQSDSASKPSRLYRIAVRAADGLRRPSGYLALLLSIGPTHSRDIGVTEAGTCARGTNVRGARSQRISGQFEEGVMNWDRIAGNWKQFTGKAKEKWGKLTDDDWTVIAGKRDQFVGKVQERYGISKDEAEKRVAEYERSYDNI